MYNLSAVIVYIGDYIDMRKTLLVSLVTVVTTLSTISFAADAPPSQPVMPGPPPGASAPRAPMFRPVFIGPGESTTIPYPVSGKVNVAARTPRDIKISSVELFVDDKSIGTSDKMPYKAEFDCSTLPEGEHTFKAIGRDESKKDVWTSSAKATVKKSLEGEPKRWNATERTPGTPGNQPTGVPNAPRKKHNAEDPGMPPPPMAPDKIQKEANQFKAPAPQDSSVKLAEKTYNSDTYGFTIRYPQTWLLKDNSSKIKPEVPGGLWVILSPEAIEKSKTVINIRRQYLQSGTDADAFAKYNDYVNKWERKSVMGNPAFATTSGSPDSKRVVHRMIIIIGGSAWMLNCTDTTGQSAIVSQTLFESIVNTLQVTKSNAKASVSVVKSKPIHGKR